MVFMSKKILFLLLVCWISLEGYHAISAPKGKSSEIILKSGEEGTLQCGFKGKAQSVYWTYHGSSSKQVILIKLDILQQTGQRRVSGYGEGRYNISEDFSLIIHDVTVEDEGRYTCEVLESTTCTLLSNYTFVSVAGVHSEVLLKSGADGTLKCDIKGEAHVVYWTYQDVSSKPVLLVRLEFFQHQVGQRRVALYAEERYNITDDFSLIIRDVTLADEGRYTCEILELTGSIVRKHSDVSVPEVKTVPNVLLESGKKAKLTCGYKRTVNAVYWRYESTTSPMELLVVLDYQVGERNGPGYDKGRFDITDEYSLIINDVEAQNEGRYTCEVSDFKTGLLLRNHTDVHTLVIAERPFVRIEQCEDSVSADDEPCVLHATLGDPSIQLTCTVVGAKPVVSLSWTSSMPSEHWKQVVNESTFTKNSRGDGSFNQTLTVNVDTLYFMSDIQHFTCIAGGLAVDGKASLTISVYLTHVKGVNVTVIAVTSAGCTLFFLIILTGILWKAIPRRRNDRHGGNKHFIELDYEQIGEEIHNTTDIMNELNETVLREIVIETKKKKISEIEELTSKNQKPLYFGIFGSRKAEKDALIDSLVYPFAGVHQREIREDVPPCRQIRWRQDIKRPSEFIAFCDMNETKDIDRKAAEQLLEPISKDKEYMREGDVIHYPIFVSDIGKHERDHGVSPFEKSLALFSEAMLTSISQYPVLVLTHKNPSEISNRERIISRLNLKTDIPVDNIFVIGSKKVDGSTEENEILQLLDLVLKCVKNSTGNISPTESKRLEIRKEIIRRNPKPIYFGIFGSTEEGKSALIDSLIYAFTGRNCKEIPDAIPAYRDTLERMSIKRPSKFIALCDMRKTNPKEVGQLLKPLSTDEGSMIKDDVIHYPIVVYEDGKHKIYEKSLPQLYEAVKTSISKYPVLVLTHKNPSKIPDREEVISRLSSKTNIPVNIFFIGNSTVDDTTEDGDILRLLEILLKCVKNVID